MAQSESGESIRFSIPTIAGEPPPLDGGKPAPGEVQCWHEDDWRQIEFVLLQDVAYLEVVLGEHADFRARHRETYGFTALYVRNDSPSPIRSRRIPIGDLEILAGPNSVRGRLFMGPTSGAFEVSGGLIFPVSGLGALYCTEMNGLVDQLGILPDASAAHPSREGVDRVAVFGEKHQLAVVDWPALYAFDVTDVGALSDWLSIRKGQS